MVAYQEDRRSSSKSPCEFGDPPGVAGHPKKWPFVIRILLRKGNRWSGMPAFFLDDL